MEQSFAETSLGSTSPSDFLRSGNKLKTSSFTRAFISSLESGASCLAGGGGTFFGFSAAFDFYCFGGSTFFYFFYSFFSSFFSSFYSCLASLFKDFSFLSGAGTYSFGAYFFSSYFLGWGLGLLAGFSFLGLSFDFCSFVSTFSADFSSAFSSLGSAISLTLTYLIS